MQESERNVPGWMDYFVVGRMPLATGWVYGLVASVGLTLVAASFELGLEAARALFVVWLGAPTVIAPFVAKKKNRRLLLWVFLSLVMLLIGVQLTFLPLATLIAVALAAPVPIRIPEAQLEAEESPSAFRSLVHVLREVAATQTVMAEEYVARDTRLLAERAPEVQKIEAKLAEVPDQKSERGQRARLHVTASARLLLRSAEAAAEVEELMLENSELQQVIRGHADVRGKPAKRAVKALSQVEEMIGRSSNQLMVASAILDDLGYPVKREAFPHEETSAVESQPAAERQTQPVQGRPRPERPRRRRRF